MEQGIEHRNLPVVTGHTAEEAGHELIYRALLSLGNEVKMLKDLILENLPSGRDIEGSEEQGSMAEMQSGRSMKEMEKEMIKSALGATGGNRKETARRLGIGERTLYRKLREYNLN